MHENKDGDWNKLEKLVKEISLLSRDVERDFTGAVKKIHALRELTMQAYKTTPKLDALLMDSPLSNRRQILYLQQLFKKLELEGPSNEKTDHLPSFSEKIKEGCLWLLKFKPDDKEKN